ncbi:MAG: cupin domain-containing protein, partial [Gammaproteobacteria bacterium]
MSTMYKKSFSDADEIKTPPKAHVSVVKLGDMNASKLILEPGWKWSECIKPVVGGDSCQAGHVGVITQGKLMCVHNDGTEVLAEAGDAYYFAPGH